MNKILPLLLGNQDKCVQMGPEVRSTEQKLCRMRATQAHICQGALKLLLLDHIPWYHGQGLPSMGKGE